MVPFFALIGLVTVISIIVNLQINRHSLLRKIIGTVILSFACVFACLAILYPLYFGSYENLIISFVVAFILLIGVYVVTDLIVNKRHIKNVVFVAAEGPAEVSDNGKTKELLKPVQLRHASAPETRRERKRLGAKTSRNEHNTNSREMRFERSVFDESVPEEKETTGIDGVAQPDNRYASSFGRDFEKEKSGITIKDTDMQFEMGDIEEAVSMKQIDSGLSETVVGLQAKQANEAGWIDSILSAIEADAETVMEQKAINKYAGETDSTERATEEDTEPQALSEADDKYVGQTDNAERTTEEDAEPQAEPEADDKYVGQTDSAEPTTEEDAEPQAEPEADDKYVGQHDIAEPTMEEDAEPQAVPEADDMDARQHDSAELTTEEDTEPLAVPEADDKYVGQMESTERNMEEDTEPLAVPEADDKYVEQMDIAEPTMEDDIEPQAEPTTEEDTEPQVEPVADMFDEQPDSVETDTKEDKYSRMISKAIELKDQGNYLNAIFILQSCYDNINDAAVKKKADMQLMECFILSGQHHEGQKKWFDILNKKYDFEPDEKEKLKYMIAELNAGQL